MGNNRDDSAWECVPMLLGLGMAVFFVWLIGNALERLTEAERRIDSLQHQIDRARK